MRLYGFTTIYGAVYQAAHSAQEAREVLERAGYVVGDPFTVTEIEES